MKDPHNHLSGLLMATAAGFIIAVALVTITLLTFPMILTTFLLLSIPLAVELREDYVQIVKKKQTDDHANDMFARGILIVVCAVLDGIANHQSITVLQMFQSILLGIAWFWLLFDYILNFFINRPILSLGTTSWFDKKMSFLPWYGVLFAKVWFFGVAIGVYYYWHLIVR